MSRGDIVPYNPIKNVFDHKNIATTVDNAAGWAQIRALLIITT